MIYLDNAATTEISQKSIRIMCDYMKKNYANPSAVYDFAIENRMCIEKARKTIASTLNVSEEEIFFTSGGSESDNWALNGIVEANKEKGKHIVTSKIEHKAILKTCEYLESCGIEVTYLNVDSKGRVMLDELKKAIREDTILVSVMYANNEIGTIMQTKEISEIAHSVGALFHTDAVQAYGHEQIDCKRMGIDLLSASGHKFHGPKGIGFLYVKKGINIVPLIFGGGQEKGKRAGTENIVGIVGMENSAKESFEHLSINQNRIRNLRNYFMNRLLNEIDDTYVIGDVENRLVNNISICIKNVNGLVLVDRLGDKGVCISTGSACDMKSVLGSHVLKAVGLEEEDAKSTVRLSLSKYTTKDEIETAINEMKKVVNEIRQIY